MKIDTQTVLTQFNGKAMKDIDESGNAIDATLGRTLINALLAPVNEDDGVAKLRKFTLAHKLYGGGIIDVSTEDVSLLKHVAGKFLPPMAVGRISEILEGLSR